MKNEGDEVLTTQEVIEMLGITRKHLYTLIHEGSIAPLPGNPLKRKQPRNHFLRADVERLLREGRKSS